jgi:hypothetical protein
MRANRDFQRPAKPKQGSAEFYLEKLLSQFPRDKAQWVSRKRAIQLETTEQTHDLFLSLVRRSTPPTAAEEALSHADEQDPRCILETYSKFGSFLRQSARALGQLLLFASLTFYCFCSVARHSNSVSTQVVTQYITAFLGHQVHQRHEKRLRSASKWVARLIEELESSLGRLASELLLACEIIDPSQLPVADFL